jgi:hypothetical protein
MLLFLYLSTVLASPIQQNKVVGIKGGNILTPPQIDTPEKPQPLARELDKRFQA